MKRASSYCSRYAKLRLASVGLQWKSSFKQVNEPVLDTRSILRFFTSLVRLLSIASVGVAPTLLLFLASLSGVEGGPSQPYRFDPAKRIPMLTANNWSEWSWRIAAAFAAMGVTTNVLWASYKQSDVSDVVPRTEEVKAAEGNLAVARQKKQLATTEEETRAADEALADAKEALTTARDSAAKEYQQEVHRGPFHGCSQSLLTDCFQLIISTVSPSLDFLIMNFSPNTLNECWTGIRNHFMVNTRGVRIQLKADFFAMTMEKNQKLAEFKARIDFAARQLNAMSPDEVVSDDDKTQVLILGVRKHHDSVFRTTLDIFEQTTEWWTFEDLYKRMIPVAKRAESDGAPSTSDVQSLMVTKLPRHANGLCKDYKRGRCRFGNKCKYSHSGGSSSGASNANTRTACSYCGGTNHVVAKCFKKKKADKQKSSGGSSARDTDAHADLLRKLERLERLVESKSSENATLASEELNHEEVFSVHEQASYVSRTFCLLLNLCAFVCNLFEFFLLQLPVKFWKVLFPRKFWVSRVRSSDQNADFRSRLGFKSLNRTSAYDATVAVDCSTCCSCGHLFGRNKSRRRRRRVRSNSRIAGVSSSHTCAAVPGDNKMSSKPTLYSFLRCYAAALMITVGDCFRFRIVADSGASSHMFKDLKFFRPETLVPCNTVVKAANGHKLIAKYRGTVFLPTADGLALHDALYVPGLTVNLLSVRRLDETGHTTTTAGGVMTIKNAVGSTVCTAALRDGLYDVDLVEAAHLAAENTQGIPPQDLWHRRLGHAAAIYLRGLLPKKSSKVELSYCDACVRAKNHRRPFKTNRDPKEVKAGSVLDVVVSDLCGPFRTKSKGGKRYFATIIDVASRYIFIFLLAAKSDFNAVFRRWVAFCKVQFGTVPKRFHSDGGGEFVNADNKQFLEREGVQFTTSAPDNPKQNSIAERANRTILESARAMMFLACAPKYLWAEAVNYAVYVRNRTPHKSLGMKVPATIFPCGVTKKNLYYHIHVWGCKAWVYVSKSIAGKLGSRAVECIFLGVDALKKAYRLMRIDNGTIILSRDVVFDETDLPLGDEKEQGDSRDGVEYVDIKLNVVPSQSTAHAGNSRWQRAEAKQDSDTAARSLRRNPEPSGQALRNIVGDAANVADSDDDNHDDHAYVFDSDPDDSLPSLVSDSDSEDSDDEDTECKAYFSRQSRAKRFKPKKKSLDPMEPTTRKQMLKLPEEEVKKWLDGEREELAEIESKEVWKEVPEEEPKRRGLRTHTAKWVYKLKRAVDHTIERYKCRLTLRGFNQVFGVDYFDVFAAVAQLKSFRLLLALAVVFGWKATQFDIKCAFLSGDLQEDLYMEHPEGYPGTPGTVLKLMKSLYGAKQSGRAFQDKLFGTLRSMGYVSNGADCCVWFHVKWYCYLCIFCDDGIIFTCDEQARKTTLDGLAAVFTVKDLGDLSRYLNIQVAQKEGSIGINQSSYVETVLKRFGMLESNPAPTPTAQAYLSKNQCPQNDDEKDKVASIPYKSIVGALWYIANGTRLEICYAVNAVAQHASNPGVAHCVAVKRILRYLRGAVCRSLTYVHSAVVRIVAYSDSDWGGDPDTRRSKTGYVVIVSGGAVAWQTKSQRTVALSSCEAELYAMCECVKELLWVRSFLSAMKIKFEVPVLYVDNQGAIDLANNPVNHQRTKHIDIRWYFIRDELKKGTMILSKVASADNLADINTKPVSVQVHRLISGKLLEDCQ